MEPPRYVKPATFYDDPDYQDRLVRVLQWRPEALEQCADLLQADDFKPQKGMKHGRGRWMVAERVLQYYRDHGKPVRKLLRSELLHWASSLRLGERAVAEIEEYITHLDKAVPLAPTEAVVSKIVQFKQEKRRVSVLEEMIELQASGDFTNEAWHEMIEKMSDTYGAANTAKPVSGAELYGMEYAAPKFLVNPMLAVGVAMLAARPKLGKTWLGLQLALAVAQSEPEFLGEKLKIYGRALYYSLEDTPRRLTSRLRVMAPKASPETVELLDKNLAVRFDWQGIEGLRAELQREKHTLVVIDPFLAVQRARQKQSRNIVADDYDELQPYRKLSQEFDTTILIIHHTRKLAGDAIDTPLGTTGTAAAIDTLWTLTHTNEGKLRKLEVRGRDVEDQILKIELGAGGWRVVAAGAAAEAGGPLQRQIAALLSDAGGPMSSKQIADALEAGRNSVQVTLGKMRESDLVANQKGRWQLCQP